MPTAIAITRVHGLDALELQAPDGARATLLLHGGHLLSWCPAGADEQLYLSPRSVFASGQAIRGGVPVIFPQFAARGALQRHGFARTKPWQLVLAEQGDVDALAVLRLSQDAATRMTWPHEFDLELTVRIAGAMLEMELACENKGDTPFEFTAALHTYFGIQSLAETSVQGLGGLHYWDSVAQKEAVQRTDLLLPGMPDTRDLDRIYYQVRDPLTLIEQRGNKVRRVEIHSQGFEDAVAWNPGADKCAQLSDMPATDYESMLCIEAACIERPVLLQPGETWAGMQSLNLA